MSKHPGIELANVYGVEVPGVEGRAGMAAITVGASLDMSGLATHLAAHLPPYAGPLFIRIQKEAQTTGTFKFRKVELVKEGFDLDAVVDPIWFLEPGTAAYTRFTNEHLASLKASDYRL